MMFNKNFSLIVIVVAAMISGMAVASSYQTANAESAGVLLDQLKSGQEGSYKISINVPTGTRAVGIFGDCNVTGKNVNSSECVFSVDAIRYIPAGRNGVISQVKFEVICIDNIAARIKTGEKITWSNCSFLERGAVSLGIGVGISTGGDARMHTGEIGSVKFGVSISPGFTAGPSFDIIRLEYLMQNVDKFRGRVAGGNVLVDSGIGGVLATKYVILGHDRFSGTVEFLGSKPINMVMMTGFGNDTGTVECRAQVSPTDKKDCNKEFEKALKEANPSSAFDSFKQAGVASNGKPAQSNILIQNAQAETLNLIIDKTKPQLKELTGAGRDLALELIDFDENISMLNELLKKDLINKILDSAIDIIKNIDLGLFLVDILKTVDPDGKLPDPIALFEGIPTLLEPLDKLDGLIKSIPDPSDIGDDIGKVSGDIGSLETAVTGRFPISTKVNLPDPLKGISCTASTAGTGSCSGKAEFNVDLVTCEIELGKEPTPLTCSITKKCEVTDLGVACIEHCNDLSIKVVKAEKCK